MRLDKHLLIITFFLFAAIFLHSQSLKEIIATAEAGDSVPQAYLGYIYLQGEG